MTNIYYIEGSDFKSAKEKIAIAYSDTYDKIAVDTENSYMRKSTTIPNSSILLAYSTNQLILTYENVVEKELNLELKTKVTQNNIVEKGITITDNDSLLTITFKVISKYWKGIFLVILCIGIPILIPFVAAYLLYKNKDKIKKHKTSIKDTEKNLYKIVAEELENGIIDKATMMQAKAQGYNSEHELETNYIKLRKKELADELEHLSI